jgi:hypothetical protein
MEWDVQIHHRDPRARRDRIISGDQDDSASGPLSSMLESGGRLHRMIDFPGLVSA